MRLANKRALVTGGASGIGYAIVERFLKEGAAVVFCDIATEATERAEKALSAGGGKVSDRRCYEICRVQKSGG